MCEFMSAVKTRNKWYFLTHELIHNTPRGEMIQKKYPGEGEVIGHSAIREYFSLDDNDGENWECTDFSSPKNFPAIIVKAIKRGDFRGFGYPYGLLLPNVYDDYGAKLKLLHDGHWVKRKPLDDDYWAKRKSLYDDYWAKRKSLHDDYWAKRKSLHDDYEAKRKPLDDDYWAKRKSLHNDYWDLFADPKNRAKAWG